MDDTPAGLPLPTPSFPPSWPDSWHAFWFPVVLISGDQSVCVLWIKCIVVFIPTSYPTLFSSAEQECMFSLSLSLSLCFSSVSLFWSSFSFCSVSAASPAKTRTWGSKAIIKTFHPGGPTSEPPCVTHDTATQLASASIPPSYTLAGSVVFGFFWLRAADWWETRKL